MEQNGQTSNVEKVPGILGGMGPEATVDLMKRIIALTPALDDVDHLRCIVDNNPKVPSRMKAIIDGDGEDPGPCMADMGKRLEAWGADFLVIPCNTAHHYYYNVAEAVNIPVVHLIDLVVETVVSQNPGIRQAGVLASTAVLMTKLYETRFAARGVEVVYPDEPVQEKLLGVIRRVKAGETGDVVRKDFADICAHLAGKGAEVGILGCTELGIIGENLPICSVDAADVLAREIVAVAREGKAPHTESSAS
ncbi:aspartate racemase [Desulfoluna limicola]|uniref:Aspartate racemase n=1 Tax=Desulfoluna limicola TaxID=2810562 RepID=A0ABN6F3N5_9BACT|nr:amino acid racemase [Desulfoluna limicola]BCS96536.1 aspartate racemase [Desulfoluna limicola]